MAADRFPVEGRKMCVLAEEYDRVCRELVLVRAQRDTLAACVDRVGSVVRDLTGDSVLRKAALSEEISIPARLYYDTVDTLSKIRSDALRSVTRTGDPKP